MDGRTERWTREEEEEGVARAGHAGPEMQYLPLPCVGSVLVCLALFAIGLAVQYGAHLAWVLVAEAAFGFGFLLVFMGMGGYILSAYKVSQASRSPFLSLSLFDFKVLL